MHRTVAGDKNSPPQNKQLFKMYSACFPAGEQNRLTLCPDTQFPHVGFHCESIHLQNGEVVGSQKNTRDFTLLCCKIDVPL